MSKLNIQSIVRTALAVCEIPHKNVTIYNERRSSDRRVKICGLPHLSDKQVRILANSLTYQLPVKSLSKHKDYEIKTEWLPNQTNALVLLTAL